MKLKGFTLNVCQFICFLPVHNLCLYRLSMTPLHSSFFPFIIQKWQKRKVQEKRGACTIEMKQWIKITSVSDSPFGKGKKTEYEILRNQLIKWMQGNLSMNDYSSFLGTLFSSLCMYQDLITRYVSSFEYDLAFFPRTGKHFFFFLEEINKEIKHNSNKDKDYFVIVEINGFLRVTDSSN